MLHANLVRHVQPPPGAGCSHAVAVHASGCGYGGEIKFLACHVGLFVGFLAEFIRLSAFAWRHGPAHWPARAAHGAGPGGRR